MTSNTSGKKVVLNSIIYSASGLLIKCFSFFLLPLYTAYLTTEDYGITSIAGSFIRTTEFIVAFSLFSAVLRFFVDLKDEPEKLKRFYGTVVTFVFISGAVFFALFTLFRGALSKYVFQGIDYYPVILICLVSLVFNCQQTVYGNILKSQQKAAKSSILGIAYFFVTLVFNILFVVVLKMGAVGSLLASLAGYVIYTVYFLIDMTVKKEIIFCLDFKLLKSALKYSVPIMPHNLSTQIASLISKILIGDSVSLAGVGIYSVAVQFGNIADTIQTYVDQAYGPWLYEKLNEKGEGYKAFIRSISKMMIAVIGFFFIGISLFSQDYIVLFVDKSYAEAWKFVPFIVLVFAIKTMYYFYVEVLFYYKKASKFLFTATLSGSIVNLILSYFFIKSYGVYGSIAADAVAMILRVLIIVIISKRFDDIGLRVFDFIKNTVVVSVFIFGGLALSYTKYQYTFSLINFAYKIAVVAVYVLLVLFLNRKSIKPFIAVMKAKFGKKKTPKEA